jgi:hypothetical protein
MLTINETLSDINKDINKVMSPDNVNNAYLRNFFVHAFVPEKKLILPEGIPPYKTNGMSDVEAKGIFWQVARKMDNMCRADLKPANRERLFIQALESVDKVSGSILIAVKEQKLSEMFPSITYAKLVEVGYFK